MERLDELEQQGVIGAFDKRTLIEISDSVEQQSKIKYYIAAKKQGNN